MLSGGGLAKDLLDPQLLVAAHRHDGVVGVSIYTALLDVLVAGCYSGP